jgi:hypothetical protein
MVPYVLKYGYAKTFKSVGPSRGTYPTADFLGTAEVKQSRSNKRTYINVYDADHEAYSTDVEPICTHDDLFGCVCAAVLNREWDWGDLQDWTEELEKGYLKIKGGLPGVIYTPTSERIEKDPNNPHHITTHYHASSYFQFDPEDMTVESANQFLKIIKGSIRIGVGG